jgi:two-component system sensor kinase FixL
MIGRGREVQGQRQDGAEVPLLLSIGDVKRDGKSLFVAILHDLTARKQAERDL